MRQVHDRQRPRRFARSSAAGRFGAAEDCGNQRDPSRVARGVHLGQRPQIGTELEHRPRGAVARVYEILKRDEQESDEHRCSRR
jgi:hypothetical protein